MDRNHCREEEKGMLRVTTDADAAEVSIHMDVPYGALGVHYRRPPLNRLTAREMETLTAISDALLPCVELSADVHDDTTREFYRLSASMAGTPDKAGAYLSGRVQHGMLTLLRMALWVMSTWYGTLVFCGRRCLSGKFPYVTKLSELPVRRRAEIVRAWSRSSIYLLRLLFRSLKFLIVLTYFTQVNEKNENLAWKGIGYAGPDPDFLAQLRKPYEPAERVTEAGDEEDREDESSRTYGPLHRAIVLFDWPHAAVSAALARCGLSISDSPRNHRLLPRSIRIKHKTIRTIHCDAVVVGSGSGGGVVAGVLAQAGHKVVVVERGHYHARRGLTLLESHAMDNMYDGGGFVITDDLGVFVLAGSTVGGGSAVNWSASLRTPQHVMDEWCDVHGLELFGSDAYREALDAVCNRMDVQSAVSDENLNNSVLRRGCRELGYPVHNIPRNADADHYCGWCCFGCKDGRKRATSETWLVDMAESGNGVILPGCSAIKVLQPRRPGRRRPAAAGVLVRFDEKTSAEEEGTYIVVEAKVTVVACGALRTPELLRRSGLQNPNIGQNLHLHPVVMAWGYFPEMGSRWPEEDKKSYEGGIMTAMSTVVSNVKSDGYGAVIQTPALHPGMFAVLTPWISGPDLKERMSRFSRTAHIFALARDRGCGDSRAFPGSLKYELREDDEENLLRGMEKMLRILAAAGAEEIGTHHEAGERLNVKTATSHEFERFVRRASQRGRLMHGATPLCSAHQMGTCRMGMEPATSAVNQTGETWEVEGLYVADTSTFPTALGVNPMVTVQAIAYCTAQSVLEVLRRSKKPRPISKKRSSHHRSRPTVGLTDDKDKTSST